MSGLAPSSSLTPSSSGSDGAFSSSDLLAPVTEKARIRIAVTADGDSVTVTRKHPSGKIVTVRGMDKAPLSGGAFLGYDYEAPIGLAVSYQATAYTDPDTVLATSTLDTVTWNTETDWLKDPLEPARNISVLVNDMSEYAYDTPTGIHTVLGRPDPVTVGEVRRAATGTLTLVTLSKEDRDRLHYITASGHVLLFQSSQDSGVGNMYIALTGVTETRVVNLRGQSERLWTIGYQEVASPVGDGAATPTWAEVVAQYASWQDVVDAGYGSWLEFIESLDTVTAPPILNWRGD